MIFSEKAYNSLSNATKKHINNTNDNESDLQALIDAVGVQGEIDDIKFNAKKSMV
jgi:hypothetical protein